MEETETYYLMLIESGWGDMLSVKEMRISQLRTDQNLGKLCAELCYKVLGKGRIHLIM